MFDPLNFLNLAEKLAEKDEEAHLRTAISRAYYASFLIARDKLRIKVQIPEVHREVIKELYTKSSIAAENLHLLRRLRNFSDYDVLIKVNTEDARKAIESARNIISEVR